MALKKALPATTPWKDIILALLGIGLLVVGIFWFIASQELVKLRKEKLELNEKLLEQQVEKEQKILEGIQHVNRNIRTLEQKQQKSRTDEQDIINAPDLSKRELQQFFTDYESPTGTGNNKDPDPESEFN